MAQWFLQPFVVKPDTAFPPVTGITSVLVGELPPPTSRRESPITVEVWALLGYTCNISVEEWILPGLHCSHHHFPVCPSQCVAASTIAGDDLVIQEVQAVIGHSLG